MSPEAEAVVNDYMRSLKEELRSLPKAQRTEILEEISEHVEQSLGKNGSASEADARNVLDQLGDPAEIASDARERFGIQASPFGTKEVLAIVLLPVGGFVFFVGWIVGVVLLWTSDAWTTREKLLGTLLPPGGLLLPFFLLPFFSLHTGEQTCVKQVTSQSGSFEIHCEPGKNFYDILGPIGVVLAIVLAVAVPIWLGLRARKRALPEGRNLRTA
jgi:hypothetical protein